MCTDADPAHRVRAGIHALKLATDIGPIELIHSLYVSLGSAIESNAVPRQDALELKIVYQSLASDELIPVRAFREFLEAGKPDVLEYFRRLMTVISSCRLTSRYSEGLQFVQEALSFASSRNLPSYAAQAHLCEVQLHVAAGDYDAADAAFRNISRSLSETENLRLTEEPFYMEARIALEMGNVERCAAALGKIGAVSSYYSQSRTTYYFALHVGLRILLGESRDALAHYVNLLKRAHRSSQFLSLQDFETYWLFRGLAALGETSEAEEMLQTYVRVHRRCRWPLSQRLAELVNSATKPEQHTIERSLQPITAHQPI